MPDSDLALLARYATRRDADAFASIVARHAGLVFATCRRILGDRAVAEEVAQETFFVLLRRPDAVNASLGGWLHRTASRLAIDTLRRDSSRRRRERTYARESPRTARRWTDIAPHLDACLESMPERQRRLLVEHFIAGVSQRRLAAHLKVSPATLCREMRRSLDDLRRRLLDRGVLSAAPFLVTMLQQHAVEVAPPTLLAGLGKMLMLGRIESLFTPAAVRLEVALPAQSAIGSGWAAWPVLRSPEVMMFLGAIASAVALALAAFSVLDDPALVAGVSPQQAPTQHVDKPPRPCPPQDASS